MTASATEQARWLTDLDAAPQFNRWVYDRIAPWLGRDILEIGCGIGNFTGFFLADNRRVTANDIDPNFAATMKARFDGVAGLEVIEGDATRINWPRRYDTIALLDVLEHLDDEQTFLRDLHGTLAAGGRLIVKVPAHPWLLNDMDCAIGHRRRYRRSALIGSLEAAGYRVLDCRYFNRAAVPAWFWHGHVLGRRHPGSGSIRIFERLTPLLRHLERWFALPFGQSLIAIAEARNS